MDGPFSPFGLAPTTHLRGCVPVIHQPPSPHSSPAAHSATSGPDEAAGFIERGEKSAAEESHHRSEYPHLHGILFSSFSSTQIRRQMAASNRLECSERLSKSTEIQDGDGTFSMQFISPRRLGSFARSNRCISTHTYSSGLTEVPQSSYPTESLYVQSPSLWSIAQSVDFYKGNGRSTLPGQDEDGINGSSISRRFSREESTETQTGDRQRPAVTSPELPGFYGEHREVRSAAKTAFRASRHEIRHGGVYGRLVREKNRQDQEGDHQDIDETLAFTQRSNADPGSVSGSGRSLTARMDASETTTVGHSRLVRASARLGRPSATQGSFPASLRVLEERELAETDGTHQTTNARVLPMHRRITARVGCPSATGFCHHQRSLVRSRERPTYQRLRVVSRTQSSPRLATETSWQSNFNTVGQLHSSGLCKQTGRNKVKVTLRKRRLSSAICRCQGNNNVGQTHPRQTECDSRRTVQERDLPYRMDVVTERVRVDQAAVSQHDVRCLRHEVQQETDEILLAVPGPSGCPHRCPVLPVGRHRHLCVPAITTGTQGVSQAGVLSGTSNTCGSISPTQGLVYDASQQITTSPTANSSNARPANATSLRRADDGPGTPQPSCVQAIWRALKEKGYSDRAVARIVGSRRQSTLAVYHKKWQYFEKWCTEHQLDSLALTPPLLADFFVYLFEEVGLQPITIKGYRAAIARVYKLIGSAWDPGSHTHLSDLLKKISIERPVTKRIFPKWDIDLVLRFFNSVRFEPLENASFFRQSQKAAFLVTMATAGRVSEIHAMSSRPDCLRFNEDGSCTLTLDPTFLAKNQLPEKAPQPLQLHSCQPKENCPVRALKIYLQATEHQRGSQQFVWCSTTSKNKASKQLISSWIKSAIKEAYAWADEVRQDAAQAPANSGPHKSTEGRVIAERERPEAVRAQRQTRHSAYLRGQSGGGPCASSLVRSPAHSQELDHEQDQVNSISPEEPSLGQVPDLSRPAHELRAVAASLAYQLGTPLQDIIRAVGWNSASTFGRFYLRHLRCQEQDSGEVVVPGRSCVAPSSP